MTKFNPRKYERRSMGGDTLSPELLQPKRGVIIHSKKTVFSVEFKSSYTSILFIL